MANIEITDQGGGTLADGILQIANGLPLDATLRNVADQNNTNSPLKLSTTLVQTTSTLQITTNDNPYIDAEDGAGNNRFTIGRAPLSQQVNVDFASNPTGSTTIVGAIRTYQDGVNLSEVVKFREDGQVTFSERVNVEADSLVTTQTSSVIAADTTNASLVIAPNGTGALIADIPDGTAAGGNARGAYSVDLQMFRTNSNQVARGGNDVIAGGGENRNGTGAYQTIGGGSQNFANGVYTTISGGLANNAGNNYVFIGGGNANNGSGGQYTTIPGGRSNTASSEYSTVAGGQSNTASTGTHATVVGGFSNVASGQYSIAGGVYMTASGARSICLGGSTSGGNTATGTNSIILGGEGNNASGGTSIIIGGNYSSATASNTFVHGPGSATAANAAVFNSGTAGGVRSIAFNNSRVDSELSIAFNTNARTTLYGQLSASNGTNTNGSSQVSQLISSRNVVLNSGQTATLSLDGTGTTNLIIPAIAYSGSTTKIWNVTIKYVAVIQLITGTATGITVGDTKSQNIEIGFKRLSSGTSSLVGAGSYSIAQEDASMNTATLVPTAGGSQELALTFTAPTFAGGGSVTCRVVAKVELVEVGF